MKSTKLIVEYDYDFEVLALISSVKAYKLAWFLNKELKIKLCKSEDLYFDFIKEGSIVISNYIYQTEFSIFRLLKNKSCEHSNTSKPYLLPELKKYDYVIQLSGEISMFPLTALQDTLKHIPSVEYVKLIDIDSIKSKENLIF
ncbi:MAG TPA: IPExxxVDY family protein [Cytophagaceae bacterium]|jgi:hypothetical protein